MQGNAQDTGRFRRASRARGPVTVRPRNIDQVSQVIGNTAQFASPVRPVGADSGSTRASRAQEGTTLDMTAMNRLIEVGARSVTVEAGMRLRDLVRLLAERGFELTATEEQQDRTVGGIISSGSLSCATAGDDAHLAAAVTSVQLVTASGAIETVDENSPERLSHVRQGYGLTGVICVITLRVRRASMYSIRHGRSNFADLLRLIPGLAASRAGVKLYLLPFRDRVFIELRESSADERRLGTLLRRVRDWTIDKLMPDLIHSLGRLVPLVRLRYRMIDSFSEASQLLVGARLVDAGSNAMEQTGKFRRIGPSSRIQYCTWLFPENRFGAALYSYREFCRRYYKVNGFRCDLPALGYRIRPDSSAALAPGNRQTLFALSLRSTRSEGWDEFLIDFGAIASRFGGIPLFNQTRFFTAAQASQAYGQRLEEFRAARRAADPRNRLLNQFFTEHLG